MVASPHTTNKIIRVAVPTPIRRTFDYLAPSSHALIPGIRVKVPFGKRVLHGVVVEIADKSEFDNLKAIIEILDSSSLFSAKQFELIKWASNYYHYPLGMLFDAVIPNWLKKNKIPDLPAVEGNCFNSTDIDLNQDQIRAITQVGKNFGEFAPFLLDGVTGSGKTEVYMQLIKQTIDAGKQALILVPEINLTPQTLQRFEQRFAVPISVLHSQVAEKQRAVAWLQARNGTAPIILGTRLAAFTPVKSPGLFIVDEEHDLSFKQQDRFRYSARDLLLKRGQLEKCPVLLGTATPSLETWSNVQSERYQYIALPHRAGPAKPPSIEIVDVRHKKLEAGLSNKLIQQVELHLNQKQQVLIFLNRRGYAPVVMCCNCGWHQSCKRCDSNMIYHSSCKQLRCHHCAAQAKLPEQCPDCSTELNLIGLGTQRIEEFLTDRFPSSRVARIDKDTAGTKRKLQEILSNVQKEEIDILIGTQMLAKGHHFPNLTLVAIVDIDHALFSADFRAMERLGQLLIQVSGRTGRAEKPGQVVLQTTQPEHPVLTSLLYNGYHEFIRKICQERKDAHLPPYTSQVLIRAETKNQNKAQNFLQKFKQLVITNSQATQKTIPPKISCLGPIAAPMEKRQGFYRAQLLLQAEQRKLLQTTLSTVVEQLEDDKESQRIRWTIDVDPLEMY